MYCVQISLLRRLTFCGQSYGAVLRNPYISTGQFWKWMQFVAVRLNSQALFWDPSYCFRRVIEKVASSFREQWLCWDSKRALIGEVKSLGDLYCHIKQSRVRESLLVIAWHDAFHHNLSCLWSSSEKLWPTREVPLYWANLESLRIIE